MSPLCIFKTDSGFAWLPDDWLAAKIAELVELMDGESDEKKDEAVQYFLSELFDATRRKAN